MKHILPLSLLLLGALAVWLTARALRTDGVAGPGERATARPAAAGDASLEAGGRGPARSTGIDAGAARTAAGAPAGALPPAPRAADRDRDLFGLVLDEAGATVPAALVVATFREGDGYSLLERLNTRAELPVAEELTAADGRFALRLSPGRPHRLRVEADGFATARLFRRYAGERVVVHLARGAVVHGRLTSEADGGPVEGARVRLESRSKTSGSLPRVVLADTLSGADGSYRLEHLSPGPAWLVVSPVSLGSPPWEPLDVPASGELVRDFSLARGVRLEGRVTGAGTGAPLAGAVVGPAWDNARSVRTDEEGRYVLAGLSERHREVACAAPGHGRETRVRSWPPTENREVIDFALQPARRAVGTIVDAAGTPVADAFVAACAVDYEGMDRRNRTDFVGGRTSPDGRFALEGLHPGMRHVLFARREGLGTSLFDFPARELDVPVVDLGRIALARGAIVRGRVVDRQGVPFADRDVRLLGWNADRTALAGERIPESIYVEGYVAERTARTDDLGRYSFNDVPAGTLRVRAMRTLRQFEQAEVFVDAGADVRVPDLVLEGGLSITGRLVASDGGPLPRVYLSIDPEDAEGAGDDIELPDDGGFAVSNLEPGHYSLSFYAYATSEDEAAGRRFANFVERGVEAGMANLAVTLPREVAITGLVVDARGAPATGAEVTARDADGTITARAEADEKGRFELRVGDGQSYDLAASPADGEEEDAPPPPLLRGVLPGGPPVVLELP